MHILKKKHKKNIERVRVGAIPWQTQQVINKDKLYSKKYVFGKNKNTRKPVKYYQ